MTEADIPLPQGMSAEKLRLYARLAGERAGKYDVPMLDMALTLNAWADVLVSKTPPEMQ